VPALYADATARCLRCGAVLRRTHRDSFTRALALSVAALAMLGVGGLMSLMTVSIEGMSLSADLLSGPEGLWRHGLWELAVVVLFTTAVAPLLRLLGVTYVLVGLGMQRPPRHLQRVFASLEHLRPWSMIEVYLLGVCVAYAKLTELVHIEIGPALYALGALMLMMAAADAVLDRQGVWEEMERRGIPDTEVDHAAVALAGPGGGAIGCETCALVCLPATADAEPRCARCASPLRRRKPNSIARSWALVIASLIFYLPANIYPVLVVVQLGAGDPSTILGGFEKLLSSGMYPLAALVLVASIVVPMLKPISLITMLVATQNGWRGGLRDRTSLYRTVRAIGRWSMTDVFMISILVAVVQFGAVITIEPGVGAVAFAAVVILTMFTAETFDSRLMWDAAMRRDRRLAA